MNGIIRWYNTNRRLIWRTFTIIIAIVLLIRVLNLIYRNQNKEKETISTTNTKETINTNAITIDDNKSVLTDKELSQSQINMLSILDTFVGYCDNGDIDSAYDLLS